MTRNYDYPGFNADLDAHVCFVRAVAEWSEIMQTSPAILAARNAPEWSDEVCNLELIARTLLASASVGRWLLEPMGRFKQVELWAPE